MGRIREAIFKEYPPRSSLGEYVDSIWYCRATGPCALHILPTTCSTLMTCDTPYGKGIVLVGALSTLQIAKLERGDIKVGVWLKPGTRYLLSPYEPSELRDRVVTGWDMGEKARELEVTIAHSNARQEKLEHLQDFIELLIREKMIVRHAIVDNFISVARATNGKAKVEDIVRELPIGYRQCSRLIKRYTGFTAKEFLKLQRFNVAAHALDLDTEGRSIAAVAACYDYADHAHFSREFRSRVGLAPSVFGEHQVL